jgi:hypothetical protein
MADQIELFQRYTAHPTPFNRADRDDRDPYVPVDEALSLILWFAAISKLRVLRPPNSTPFGVGS